MLKGHVFSHQIFGNPIFALFINTFLDGANGISDNYKNGMALSHSGSSVTIDSGAVIIQGRPLEEDLSTTLSAGTDAAYCKLVIEIDLDKTNTAVDFQQGSYKIIKGQNDYPSLTQTNIVKNNAGVYQYELARFKTGANGITDFQDMRTFLNFNSIWNAIRTEYRALLATLQEELENVNDGSEYVLKEVKTQSLTYSNEDGVYITINFKRAGNVVECNVAAEIPASTTTDTLSNSDFLGNVPDWAYPDRHLTKRENSLEETSGGDRLEISKTIIFVFRQSGHFNIICQNKDENYSTPLFLQFTYIVDDTDRVYIEGDVDGNGTVDETDLSLIKANIMGIPFTAKQKVAADLNHDGQVDSKDYMILKNQLGL
jgi:hypothetical protein